MYKCHYLIIPDSKQYRPLAFISAVLQLSLGSVEGGRSWVAPIFSIRSCPPMKDRSDALRASANPYTVDASMNAVAWFNCSLGPGKKIL